MLPAQVDLAVFEGAFQDFADAAVGSLASTATSGLAWSPAHIGQFPHFGVGLTVGAAMMPYEAVKPVFDMLSITLPSELDFLQTYGVPLPAAAIDARLGGFGIPFDIGFKIGFIPEQVQALLGDVQADYFIAGGDFRFAILQDKGFVPALSVGVGYSYLKGGVEVAGLIAGPARSMSARSWSNPAGLKYPQLLRSHPRLHLAEPRDRGQGAAEQEPAHLHAARRVRRRVRPGLVRGRRAALGGHGLQNGTETLAEIQDAFEPAGETAPTDQGFTVAADAPAGWALRVFGGTSINLLFLRLDLDANWNVLTGSYGGNVNLRFEL